jgi:hypothetical protein
MKTGDRLPNGAVVLLERSGVVLAHNEGAVQPYVTWKWDGTDPRSTFWGHYFHSLTSAASDFEIRSGLKRYRNEGNVAVHT